MAGRANSLEKSSIIEIRDHIRPGENHIVRHRDEQTVSDAVNGPRGKASNPVHGDVLALLGEAAASPIKSRAQVVQENVSGSKWFGGRGDHDAIRGEADLTMAQVEGAIVDKDSGLSVSAMQVVQIERGSREIQRDLILAIIIRRISRRAADDLTDCVVVLGGKSSWAVRLSLAIDVARESQSDQIGRIGVLDHRPALYRVRAGKNRIAEDQIRHRTFKREVRGTSQNLVVEDEAFGLCVDLCNLQTLSSERILVPPDELSHQDFTLADFGRTLDGGGWGQRLKLGAHRPVIDLLNQERSFWSLAIPSEGTIKPQSSIPTFTIN